MLKRLPKITPNFYFVSALLFFVWMLIFDRNDIFTQYNMRSKLKALENERAYYLEKIAEVEKDRKELLSNTQLLEKFAREKYLMKKPTEDVYIVVEEK
jgi:cell division protein DivIC